MRLEHERTLAKLFRFQPLAWKKSFLAADLYSKALCHSKFFLSLLFLTLKVKPFSFRPKSCWKHQRRENDDVGTTKKPHYHATEICVRHELSMGSRETWAFFQSSVQWRKNCSEAFCSYKDWLVPTSPYLLAKLASLCFTNHTAIGTPNDRKNDF